MRIIRRTLAVSALALPLIIGTAGIASADTYYDHDGGACYANTAASAGPDGAASNSTSSSANGYGAAYGHEASSAGPDGASTSSTHSGTHDWTAGCDYHHGSHYWNDTDNDGGPLDILGL